MALTAGALNSSGSERDMKKCWDLGFMDRNLWIDWTLERRKKEFSRTRRLAWPTELIMVPSPRWHPWLHPLHPHIPSALTLAQPIYPLFYSNTEYLLCALLEALSYRDTKMKKTDWVPALLKLLKIGTDNTGKQINKILQIVISGMKEKKQLLR